LEDQIWPVRWSQKQRLEFIEFRLFWEGRVNRSDLVQFFGISVPQASLDFARYREIAPENAIYDSTAKSYLAGSAFASVLADASAEMYLSRLFAVESGNLEPFSTLLGWRPPAGVVRPMSRTLNVSTLRIMLRAIREHRTVEIDYQSMNAAMPANRKITPHALGFDGFRWHARAFCHQHLDYRDFVLARILGIRAEEVCEIDHQADLDWHRYAEAVIVPGRGLSSSQQKVIELDYGMENGRLVLQVREALLFYYLKHLGLLYGSEDCTPTDQIDLANRRELEPFFKKHGIGSQ
jgi:WYL domain